MSLKNRPQSPVKGGPSESTDNKSAKKGFPDLRTLRDKAARLALENPQKAATIIELWLKEHPKTQKK